MNKKVYVRQIENPSFELVGPVIHGAFQTSHQQFQLDQFSHSGIYFSKSDFDTLRERQTIWFGAYDREVLVGCVAVTLMGTVRARINKLAVMPDYRSEGLGKLLMCYAEREAFAWGARRIELVCLANDEPLVAFYQNLNYKRVKEKPYKQSHWRIAYLEKKMPHLIDQVGKVVHAYDLPTQGLETLKKEAFEVVLVYHPREIQKPSNTGHVIQRSLPEHTKELIWHRQTFSEQINQLSEAYETILLYLSDDAVALNQYALDQSNLEKPLRLIVIDGTWQQAQKMMLQSPALKELPKAKLVHLPKSQYALRKNQKPMGVCTLESVAEALSELGYPEVKSHLMNTFFEWLELGYNRYKG